MGIYENVLNILKVKGISIHAAEVGAGLANGTISGWKNGRPYADTLLKLANFLECQMDDLVEKE